MGNNNLELSIVVPCKNEERYIGKLLNSLEKQNYPIEKTKIFIADANSTDDTINEIKKNKKLDVQIVKGGMPSVGRNNGAKLCKSKYILFIDADIELEDRNIIKNSVELMKKDELCCAATNIKCKNGNFLDNILFFNNHIIKKCSRYFLPYANGAYMMFERKKFWELGGFDDKINYAEDYFLTKKLKSKEFGIVKGKVYTTNRRFKKIGYGKTIINFVKTAIKSGNEEHFYKDNGYWD